jgi:hypothetical protein
MVLPVVIAVKTLPKILATSMLRPAAAAAVPVATALLAATSAPAVVAAAAAAAVPLATVHGETMLLMVSTEWEQAAAKAVGITMVTMPGMVEVVNCQTLTMRN